MALAVKYICSVRMYRQTRGEIFENRNKLLTKVSQRFLVNFDVLIGITYFSKLFQMINEEVPLLPGGSILFEKEPIM